MYKSKLISIKEFIKILNNLSPNYQIRVYHKNKGRRKKHMNKKNALTLEELAKKIDNLGNDLRNEMNTGFKQVNARLDYIVKANNLKDSK